MSEDIKVNPISEQFVVELVDLLFGKISYISADEFRKNVELLCDGGFSLKDRTIRASVIETLFDKFAYLFIGLVTDSDFRADFVKAVEFELYYDKCGSETIRKSMRDHMYKPEFEIRKDTPYLVVDLSKVNDGIIKMISRSILKSFDKVADLDDTIDSLMKDMTPQDRTEVGFCVSNFAYLIRAFSQNHKFTNFVIETAKIVEEHFSTTD